METFPNDLHYYPEVTPSALAPRVSARDMLAEHKRAQFVLTRGAFVHTIEADAPLVQATERNVLSQQALAMAGGMAVGAAYQAEATIQQLLGANPTQREFALIA